MSTIVICLLIGISQQATLTFSTTPASALANGVVPTGNSQLTTSLISWDHGTTNNPLYINERSVGASLYLMIWDQNNMKLANKSLTGLLGYMLDANGKKILTDVESGNNGPTIYLVDYYPGTNPAIGLTGMSAYNLANYKSFAGRPVQSLEPSSSNIVYLAHTVSGSSTSASVVTVDTSSGSSASTATYPYTLNTDEKAFILLPTTSAKSHIAFLGFAGTGVGVNTLFATFLSKTSLASLRTSKTRINVPPAGISAGNFAILDSVDETVLYFIAPLDNRIVKIPGLFDANSADLTYSAASTASIAQPQSPQNLEIMNMGPFAMVAGIAQDGTLGWTASVFSKSDLSLLSGGVVLSNEKKAGLASAGIYFNIFLQTGSSVVIPCGITASVLSANDGYSNVISNITFKMCSDGTYLYQTDSACYATGSFPAKTGNSTVLGSINLTIATCADANCITCTAKYDVCTQCDTGYILNSANGCSVACPANCATCSSPATCTACSPGYALSGGSCSTSQGGNTGGNSSSNSTNTTNTNSASPASNSKAVAIGVGLGIGLGVGIPVVAGGISVLITKLVLRRFFKVPLKSAL